jgi:hypothetical protein
MSQPAQKLSNPEPTSGPAPEHKIHYGRVDLAIWKRQGEGGSWYSTSITRSYKDKDDQWQRTPNLDEEDLLPAARALEEAFTWMQTQRQKARDEALRELRPPSGRQGS